MTKDNRTDLKKDLDQMGASGVRTVSGPVTVNADVDAETRTNIRRIVTCDADLELMQMGLTRIPAADLTPQMNFRLGQLVAMIESVRRDPANRKMEHSFIL